MESFKYKWTHILVYEFKKVLSGMMVGLDNRSIDWLKSFQITWTNKQITGALIDWNPFKSLEQTNKKKERKKERKKRNY